MHWGRRGSRGAKFLGSGRGREGGPRAEAVHTFQGNKGGLARGELVGKPAARAEVPRLDRLAVWTPPETNGNHRWELS